MPSTPPIPSASLGSCYSTATRACPGALQDACRWHGDLATATGTVDGSCLRRADCAYAAIAGSGERRDACDEVCIVGASGKLGPYMVQHALDRGYEVVGVCRAQSVAKLDAFKGRIIVIPGATSDRQVIRNAVISLAQRGADVHVNVALQGQRGEIPVRVDRSRQRARRREHSRQPEAPHRLARGRLARVPSPGS